MIMNRWLSVAKRRIARCALLLSIALLFVFALSSSTTTAGSAGVGITGTVTVIGTIQSAINDASEGDTVVIQPGTYRESIVMKPGIVLQGSGTDVTKIVGSASYDYTVTGADNSTISGFTISGSVYGIYNHYSSPTITNNIITGNGNGIYNEYSSPTITNNTIVNNGNGIYNSASSPTITNNIITGGWIGIGDISSSHSTIGYNNVWGNSQNYYFSSPGLNDISADPLFVDLGAGDYHLQAGSPSIDAGSNEAPGLPEADADGNPRIIDGDGDAVATVDIGAFESQADTTLPDILITAPADEAIYALHQFIAADYIITDEGSGIAYYEGTVPIGEPINTDSLGVKSFTVTATDNVGNTSSTTHHYEVREARDIPPTIVGTSGNDILIGTSGDDVIHGMGGSDIIYGMGGNDIIWSGSGNDLIVTGGGNDLIDAGDGKNIIIAGDGHNVVFSGTKNDTIITGAGNDLIDAGDGKNIVYAGEGDNNITTGRKDDDITVGDGNNTIYAGDGNDTIYAGDGNNWIDCGDGNDTVYAGGGDNTILNCENQ